MPLRSSSRPLFETLLRASVKTSRDILIHLGACTAAGILGLAVQPSAQAQHATPTAIRRAALQVGGGFSLADSDYSQKMFRGGSVYATLDVSPHFGAEFMFHQVNTQFSDRIYERTYELGPRYVLHYGAVEPYVRVSYGRGVFNYPNGIANLAYNMVTAAGGADVRLSRHIYARGEYEIQRWINFPPNALQPAVITLGAAYRF